MMPATVYTKIGNLCYGVGGWARLLVVIRALGEIADGAKNPEEVAKKALETAGAR